MICARCKNEPGTIIHSRRFRVRTQDWYIVYWGRKCQNEAVQEYNRRHPNMREVRKIRLENNPNIKLMEKYA